MEVEQLLARIGNRKEVAQLTAEQQKVSMEMEANAELVRLLVKHPGWKVVKEAIDKYLGTLSESLKRINAADVNLVRNIQSDIRAMEKLVAHIESFK